MRGRSLLGLQYPIWRVKGGSREVDFRAPSERRPQGKETVVMATAVQRWCVDLSISSISQLSILPGTVISMSEDPFPSRNSQTLSPAQRALVQTIRRNLVNVFRHLSKASSAAIVRNPLLILHLRSNIELGDDVVSESSEKFVAQNGPSLLFYYLFDDWYLSYGLVTRKEQQYGTILDNLV